MPSPGATPTAPGGRINTTSSLLAALLEGGWLIGRKRGGTRWVYQPGVSRDEGLRQLARRAVEAFCTEPGDGWHLVWAALERLEIGERLSTPPTGVVARPAVTSVESRP